MTRLLETLMRITIFLFALLCTGAALADDKPAATQDPCEAFAWNMARELNLLRSTPIALNALTQQSSEVRETPLDHRLDLKLAANSEVKLLAKPRHEPAADSYSGLLLLKVPRISTYRISTDQPLWMEVVGPDGAVQSTKFAMGSGCKVLHKSVAFRLQPDTEYWIQLSGSAVPNPVLLITLDR
jgi:hypothetical protein